MSSSSVGVGTGGGVCGAAAAVVRCFEEALWLLLLLGGVKCSWKRDCCCCCGGGVEGGEMVGPREEGSGEGLLLMIVTLVVGEMLSSATSRSPIRGITNA
jgi:hypothetical protein